MRPTGAANEAALPPSRSRKSSMSMSTSTSTNTSIARERRPSVSSTQPTSFFLAREEDVFKVSSSSRRGSTTSDKSAGKHHHRHQQQQPTEDQTKAQADADANADANYGVQSLEDALGQAFGSSSSSKDACKEAPEETSKPSSPIAELASLLKRKRPGSQASEPPTTTLTGASNDAPRTTTNPPPQLKTPQRSSRTNTISQPLTPIRLESPFPESTIPGTPRSGSFRSLRLSDGEEDQDHDRDEAASQAITSGGEEEDDDDEAVAAEVAESRRFSSIHAPQLVMPSLAMPSRRPFTDRGKQMGRLKVAVAGANGVGKTSLIRAIVRQCEDIVHLDPSTATATASATAPIALQSTQAGKKNRRHHHVLEIQASTKAYPPWWSDVEDSRILRRRKSMSEVVLERNLSFIDTSGFDTRAELKTDKQPLVAHLEQLFQRNAVMPELSASEMLGMLSGAGGVQVDVVLYICSPAESLTQHDFAYMTRLSQYATVIPIIAKADSSPESELLRRKETITHELPRLNINPKVLSRPRPLVSYPEQTPMPQDIPFSSSYLAQAAPQAPFVVSCLPGSDDGEMDASLLMSPSYTPPLISSELQTLVDLLFHPETMAKLRHISSRKFLQWRERIASSPSNSLALVTSEPATGLGNRDQLALSRRRITSLNYAQSNPFNLSSTSIGNGLPGFSRARIRDHISSEERLAQVQLAKWAADLQRSIRREKEEYARLVDGERARWLLKRVGEEAASGGLIGSASAIGMSVYDESEDGKWRRRLRNGTVAPKLPIWARSQGEEDVNDPLGLCRFVEGVTRTGGVVLRLLGGGVLVGAVWVVICRTWGWEEGRWFTGIAW